jgi:putative tricarboxylic transport membrane protein
MYRICVIIFTALLLAETSFGQDYPSRVITLIVPYAAGGGVDVVARVIAQPLSEHLGQKIIVENVTGAGGVIGTQRVARAQPDGYTFLFAVKTRWRSRNWCSRASCSTTARRTLRRSA